MCGRVRCPVPREQLSPSISENLAQSKLQRASVALRLGAAGLLGASHKSLSILSCRTWVLGGSILPTERSAGGRSTGCAALGMAKRLAGSSPKLCRYQAWTPSCANRRGGRVHACGTAKWRLLWWQRLEADDFWYQKDSSYPIYSSRRKLVLC